MKCNRLEGAGKEVPSVLQPGAPAPGMGEETLGIGGTEPPLAPEPLGGSVLVELSEEGWYNPDPVGRPRPGCCGTAAICQHPWLGKEPSLPLPEEIN